MKLISSFVLKKKAHFCEKFKRCVTVTLAFALAFALGMPVQALGAPSDTTINSVSGISIDGVDVSLFNYDASANDTELGRYGYKFFHADYGKGAQTAVDETVVNGEVSCQRSAGDYNKPDMAPTLGGDGFPTVVVPEEISGVSGGKSVSMGYLFSKGSGYYQGSASDGAKLFQLVDGYYQYDSKDNAAFASVSDETKTDEEEIEFTLYDTVVRPSYVSLEGTNRSDVRNSETRYSRVATKSCVAKMAT